MSDARDREIERLMRASRWHMHLFGVLVMVLCISGWAYVGDLITRQTALLVSVPVTVALIVAFVLEVRRSRRLWRLIDARSHDWLAEIERRRRAT
jgi:glucan phosphoethanolaminetransferase (alkaline phosphatase superfamily)